MSTTDNIAAMNRQLMIHGSNLPPVFSVTLRAPSPSEGDLLWEKVRLQLTRYNRIIAIPLAEWQAVVSASNGVAQVITFKNNYS